MSPPQPRVRTGGDDDGSPWKFKAIDVMTGATLLSEFSKTYDASQQTADFSKKLLTSTNVPQGILGFAKYGEVRLVLQFVEQKVDIATIIHIAAPALEFEAVPALAKAIKNTKNIEVDHERLKQNQPRWYLAMTFYE